ncbi:MAG: class I SAM-dependent methyltransferase [Bacillota bacterium]|nr:class I SAM-dependent methyltransferase [Bacillota bacterium]
MGTYNRFAEIYDGLIAEDVDYALWRDFIIGKCSQYNIPMKDYLDLGCGTGNLSLIIGKLFSRCWCVDLSEDMLIIAEEKFRENRIKARFIMQNMIDLNLNTKFNLITSSLDCINYLTGDGDLDKLFSRIHAHLKDDGLFIFDINSEYKLKNILGENTFTYNSDEVVYIWENRIESEIVEMELTFFVKCDDFYERFDECHRERIYSHSDIRTSLNNNGLMIIDTLDNYTDQKPSYESERITYIIGKAT